MLMLCLRVYFSLRPSSNVAKMKTVPHILVPFLLMVSLIPRDGGVRQEVKLFASYWMTALKRLMLLHNNQFYFL